MGIVNFKLPILVKDIEVDSKTNYFLRPLFLPYPIAIHPRFSQATNQLKKEIKNIFRGYKFNRSESDRLLWFLFSPEFSYQQIHFEFKLGREWVKGPFSVVHFVKGGHTFVYLPTLNHYMFIAKADKQGFIDMANQAEKAIKKVLTQIKIDTEDDFEIEPYFSSKKEFISHIEMSLKVESSGFKFEDNGNMPFFASMGNEEEFDGSTEVEKVGFEYNGRYPDELDRAWYREEAVQSLYELLYNKSDTPIAIIGPEGVGKHTILQEAVYRYLSNIDTKSKERKQNIWHLNPNRIIAGMSIVGYWQKRMEAIISFIKSPENNKGLPDKLLFDNPIALLSIGKSANNNLTLSDILKPYLEKRELQTILIASLDEWKMLQDKNRAFAGLFQIIRLDAPDTETAIKILLEKRKQLELDNYLSITINAIGQLLDLHRNFLRNKALPGSIISILTQLSTKYRFRTIDAPEVREEFRNSSGLDPQIIESDQTYQKEEIKDALKRRLVGQEEAVDALADAIHLAKAKLTDSNKPQSSFLFIGPTGVGKTEAAKTLCQYLMSEESKLMRFDMNEFIDAGAAARLTGSTYRPEGLLTGKLRYNPYGVLLFDEIEKAHPDVHDLLLQILDDGRLTDGAGRTVDFCNTIIIMTSNIGAEDISRNVGFSNSEENINAIYRKAVETFFRPELINRIDKIVIFNALRAEHITRIAQLQIKELLKRDGFVQRTTILNISNEALEWVAERGYDPKMGGRALKRQIENDLTRLSAEHLIGATDNNPIIFHVLLENGLLKPKIEQLEFCATAPNDPLPEMPNYTLNPNSFYKKILRDIQKIERAVNNISKTNAPYQDHFGLDYATKNWQLYHFKERIASIKEKINTSLLSQSGKFSTQKKVNTLRLKKAQLAEVIDWQKDKNTSNFVQEKTLEELSRHLNQLNPVFDSINSNYIDHYIDVYTSQKQLDCFIKQEIDNIKLVFETSISGRGEQEIAFLMDLYIALLEAIDIQYKVDKHKNTINIEGYGLQRLFENEAGIQLFYSPHQAPLPLRISLFNNDKKLKQNNQIIRMFYNGQTMLDLRTNLLNIADMSTEEFKVVWFGGI